MPVNRSYGFTILKMGLKAGLLIGCLAFLFYQLDLSATRAALLQYNPFKAGMLSLWFLTSFLFLGARLYIIAQGRIRLKDCVSAVFIGFFANSMFPARIGEAVKGLYLKVASGESMVRTIALIFRERFCDLNMMLVLILFVVAAGNFTRHLMPFLATVLFGWAMLGAVHLFFRKHPACSQKIPWPWLQNSIQFLSRTPDTARILKLGAANLLVWTQFILEMFIAIYWIAGFNISLAGALNVFVISALAFAIPASPGGMGVYDAAIVFALGKYGVSSGDAVAFAILMRAIQYVPTLIIGTAMIMAKSNGLSEIVRPAATRKMLAAMAIAPTRINRKS